MTALRVNDPFDIDLPLLRPWLRAWGDGDTGADVAPSIRLDVHEDDGAYTVKAEIPGVKKEDIDVRIDGPRVTLSAEVKQDSESKDGGRVLRSERRYGWASRSFTLASDVDEAKADAKYRDGVLELHLPKKAAAGTRRLAIG